MASPIGPCGTQYVKAYKRKDGTYVQAHNKPTPSKTTDKNGKVKWMWKAMK